VTAGGFSLDDTIAAIATPPGEGGVGIVKISGPRATEILQHLFRPTSSRGAALPPVPRRLTRGHIHDPLTGQIVDEVLTVLMPAPHSYTCQDVVEIQTHGGIVVVQRILELVLAAGARPAAPGEMTLRAFLNGRLDLAQAEAVLDIVTARTEAALRVAVDQLDGHLSRQLKPLRTALVNVLAYLEAIIDFVEDEIPPQDIRTPLDHAEAALVALLATADRGMIYRQGARAAIVGRPNVGKSSLLNALLRGERAIVTPVPGTTRDTLEETINLHGVPLVVVDTAGIRLSADNEIEQLGIERSRAALQRADLALLVIDGSQPLDALDETIAALIGHKSAIVVVNKRDLPTADATVADQLLPDARHVAISALTGDGLAELEHAILDQLLGGRIAASETPLVSNPRHKAVLGRALDHVRAARAGEQGGLSPELLAIDVRAAIDELGEITGETASADVIEAIFSQFCLGK
jgi:tRNA modification GTPase